MWSIIPASVVVLPEPVGPVTEHETAGLQRQRGEHRRQSEILERDRADADPAEDQAGTSRADRKALTRKRPTPAIE